MSTSGRYEVRISAVNRPVCSSAPKLAATGVGAPVLSVARTNVPAVLMLPPMLKSTEIVAAAVPILPAASMNTNVTGVSALTGNSVLSVAGVPSARTGVRRVGDGSVSSVAVPPARKSCTFFDEIESWTLPLAPPASVASTMRLGGGVTMGAKVSLSVSVTLTTSWMSTSGFVIVSVTWIVSTIAMSGLMLTAAESFDGFRSPSEADAVNTAVNVSSDAGVTVTFTLNAAPTPRLSTSQTRIPAPKSHWPAVGTALTYCSSGGGAKRMRATGAVNGPKLDRVTL